MEDSAQTHDAPESSSNAQNKRDKSPPQQVQVIKVPADESTRADVESASHSSFETPGITKDVNSTNLVVSTTTQPNESKVKPRFQLPSPELAHQIRNAIKLSSAQLAGKDKDSCITMSDSLISSVAVSGNQIAESTVSSSTVQTAPVATPVLASRAPAAIAVARYDSSSSSSDSSDADSSSDEDAQARGTTGKVVLNLEGAEIPKQLMMRCRVKLKRLTEDFIANQTYRPTQTAELASPTDSHKSFEFHNPQAPQIVNTKRESKARPLSKIKISKSSDGVKLYKSPDIGALDTLDKLTKCQGCRVMITDCLLGASLPQYAKKLLEQYDNGLDEDYIIDEQSEKMPKKKKKKGKDKLDVKVKQEVMSEDEKPSKTKHKKAKSERRRVLLDNSSDEENVGKSENELETRRQERAEKIRLLAEKKSGTKHDTGSLKKDIKKGSKVGSSSYTSPWSEAIATSGMPKIAKINKVQSSVGSYVPATSQQFRSGLAPLDRLKKREERRREFERQAAMRYGANQYQGSPYGHPNNPYNVDLRGNQVNANMNAQRPPLPHQIQNEHRVPLPHQKVNMEQRTGSIGWATSNVLSTNMLRSGSPTPSYPIPKPPIPSAAVPPRPPIPGQLSLMELNVTFTNPKPVPLPVAPPPLDPRALLPLPESLRSPPQPVIPAKPKPGILPEPKQLMQGPDSLLPDPDSLFSAPDALLPDPSATELPEQNLSRSLSTTSANKEKAAPIKGLLPNPDTIPGHNKGLLPDPASPSESPSGTRKHTKHEQFRDILDEDDWRIISQPSAPINKRKKTVLDEVARIGNKRRSRNDDVVESPDNRTMAADSTSDDPPVNQDVLDEICRLSLEISRRIAKKTADDDEDDQDGPGPAIIPLEADRSQDDVVCYDYGHSKPPPPEEPAPLPTDPAPKQPTPPPSLAPPPLPPSLQARSAPSTSLRPHPHNAPPGHLFPEMGFKQTEDYPPDMYEPVDPYTAQTDETYAEEEYMSASRHVEPEEPQDECYDDILALEQERTRKELYYEDLRQEARRDSDRDGDRRYASSSRSYSRDYDDREDYDGREMQMLERRDMDRRDMDRRREVDRRGYDHERQREMEMRERERREFERVMEIRELERREMERERFERAQREAIGGRYYHHNGPQGRPPETITRDRYGLPIAHSDDEEDCKSAQRQNDDNTPGNDATESNHSIQAPDELMRKQRQDTTQSSTVSISPTATIDTVPTATIDNQAKQETTVSIEIQAKQDIAANSDNQGKPEVTASIDIKAKQDITAYNDNQGKPEVTASIDIKAKQNITANTDIQTKPGNTAGTNIQAGHEVEANTEIQIKPEIPVESSGETVSHILQPTEPCKTKEDRSQNIPEDIGTLQKQNPVTSKHSEDESQGDHNCDNEDNTVQQEDSIKNLLLQLSAALSNNPDMPVSTHEELKNVDPKDKLGNLADVSSIATDQLNQQDLPACNKDLKCKNSDNNTSEISAYLGNVEELICEETSRTDTVDNSAKEQYVLPKETLTPQLQPSSLKELCHKLVPEQCDTPLDRDLGITSEPKELKTRSADKCIPCVGGGEAPMDLDDDLDSNISTPDHKSANADLYDDIYTDVDTDQEHEAKGVTGDDSTDVPQSQEPDGDINQKHGYDGQAGGPDLRTVQDAADFSMSVEASDNDIPQTIDMLRNSFANQTEGLASFHHDLSQTNSPHVETTRYKSADNSGYETVPTASYKEESFIDPLICESLPADESGQLTVSTPSEHQQHTYGGSAAQQSSSQPPLIADVPTSVRFSTGVVKLPAAMQRILAGVTSYPSAPFCYQPPTTDNVLSSANKQKSTEQILPGAIVESTQRQTSPMKKPITAPLLHTLIPLLTNIEPSPALSKSPSGGDTSILMEAPPALPSISYSVPPLSMPPAPPIFSLSIPAGRLPTASRVSSSLTTTSILASSVQASSTSSANASQLTAPGYSIPAVFDLDPESIPLPFNNPPPKEKSITIIEPTNCPQDVAATFVSVTPKSHQSVHANNPCGSLLTTSTPTLQTCPSTTTSCVSAYSALEAASISTHTVSSGSPPFIAKNGSASVRSVTLPTKSKSAQPVGIASVFRSGDADSKPNTPPSRNDSPESLNLTTSLPEAEKMKESALVSGLLKEKASVKEGKVETAPSILSQIAATLSAINTIVGHVGAESQEDQKQERKPEKYKPRPKSKQLERDRRRLEEEKVKKNSPGKPSSRSSSLSSSRSARHKHKSPSDKRRSERRSKSEAKKSEKETEITALPTDPRLKSSNLPTDPRLESPDLPTDPRQRPAEAKALVVETSKKGGPKLVNDKEKNETARESLPPTEMNIEVAVNIPLPEENSLSKVPAPSQKCEQKTDKVTAKKLDGSKVDTTSHLEKLSVEALQARLQYLNQVVKRKVPVKRAQPAATITKDEDKATIVSKESDSLGNSEKATSVLPAMLQNVLKTISPSTLESLKQVITPVSGQSIKSVIPKIEPAAPISMYMTTVPPELRNISPEDKTASTSETLSLTDEKIPEAEIVEKQDIPSTSNATFEPVMPMGKLPLTEAELAALALEEAADREYIQKSGEELKAAQFFNNIASGPPAEEEISTHGGGIPGLAVIQDREEDYEQDLGKPKYKYPLSVPELSEELSDQIRIILDNTSSCSVLRALVRVCMLHTTDLTTFSILKRRNPELTDISNVYNKALINLLSHDDMFRLVTAAGLQQAVPQLEIHPMVRELLLKVYREMMAPCDEESSPHVSK